MKQTTANILILACCWALVAGVGGYLTFFYQPQQIETLKKNAELAVLKHAEADALVAQAASSEEAALETMRRWRARYKVMPASLRSHEVIGYLNDLTQYGFKSFDVSVGESQTTEDYSLHTLNITGRGLYGSLYKFVWDIENNRDFYRIRTLNLDQIDLVEEDSQGRPRLQVMVSFSLTLEAYFGGAAGMSALDATGSGFEDSTVVAEGKRPPPVPSTVLPKQRPDINPFFPIILDELPPNTYDLVDMNTAELISIADGKAVFRDDTGYRALPVGGEVYLGELILIDPEQSRVVARLNKGGIIDHVEIRMNDVLRARQTGTTANN